MRIAIDCRLIGQSGIGTFIENVLYHIVNHHEVSFLLIGNKDKLAPFKNCDNCDIQECDIPAFTLKELLKFPVTRINQCDAFYTPNFNIPGGIKIPIYCTIHDVVFLDTDNFCHPAKKFIYKWFIKRALRLSKEVFTVSEFSKKRICHHFHVTQDIKVINNGINKQLIEYQQQHATSTASPKGIVFLGNLKRHKGIHLIIKAVEMLKERNGITMPLTIIGKFNFRTKDKDIIELLKHKSENITFLSNATNEEVYDVIRHSAVLVSPSYYEGFGIPPLEALYLGTNVIISDIEVYKEVYQGLPVTFFKSGNANDLYQKLKEFKLKKIDLTDTINSRYHYSITANKILRIINNDFA